MHPQHLTRPIGLKATIADMTFAALARIDVERAGLTVRVLIGPTGEALLPAGMALPPAAQAEIERHAEARYLQEYAQGQRARRAGPLRSVNQRTCQAGFLDRIVGATPLRFDTAWHYEHGRAVANGALAGGINPTGLSRTQQAELLCELLLDGSIV